ncbi:MAG: FliI/YscN family ATPase [Deltaproteobacteria bacterium]|nr:FliI/YscN family ATPase [Deltaproteobacteria bacterium]
MSDRLKDALSRIDRVQPAITRGRVTALSGIVLRIAGLGLRVGDQVRILRDGDPLAAEVVAFQGQEAVALPLDEPHGVGPDSLVERVDAPELYCGEGLLGRVLDGQGAPLDGRSLPAGLECWPLHRPAPEPLSRPRISQPISLGVRVLDGLLTAGEGQRIGLFAGSGVGKSTLLGWIARRCDADVCVVCLVGERGREVRDFVEESLGEGLSRSVVFCATGDMAPMLRLRCVEAATSVAEYFRERGKRVLLLVDSITRYARALREIGLAAGEAPARRGYPPSVFARLPRILERSGMSANGSITAIYTVLVEGSDMEEPIADEVRGILDGHVVLSRELAERHHFPAIDVSASLSRVMTAVTSDAHQLAASRVRQLLATYEQNRELIILGAYRKGSDPRVDQAIAMMPKIEAFLRQRVDERSDLDSAASALAALLDV